MQKYVTRFFVFHFMLIRNEFVIYLNISKTFQNMYINVGIPDFFFKNTEHFKPNQFLKFLLVLIGGGDIRNFFHSY
jgi:hypothetical protein